MTNFFEDLMGQNRKLTESLSNRVCKESKGLKKISYKKINLESMKIFEDSDFDELDQKFAVDPEESQEGEVVLVIDPELPSDEEVPEDAAEDLVGDYVYKCPVCGSNYVCNCDAEKNESLEVDDDGVPIECPICGDDADQILVGEIAPVEEAGEEVDIDSVDSEDSLEDELVGEDEVEETEEEEEEYLEDSIKRPRPRRRIKEDAQAASVVDKYQEWVDYDMKKYGKISDETNKKLAKAGFEVVKDGHGDYEVIAKEVESCGSKKLKEDFDEEEVEDRVEDFDETPCPECGSDPCVCDVDADNGLDLVIPEEEEVKEEEAPAVEIDAEVVNLTLDDKRFESMMTKMIRENYKNNPSYKVGKVTSNSKKGTLKVEYVVREGKKRLKGVMVAEGFNRKSRTMTLRFKDRGVFTESFTRRPSIVMECVVLRGRVIPTKMKYGFTKRVNESLFRVSGSVGK